MKPSDYFRSVTTNFPKLVEFVLDENNFPTPFLICTGSSRSEHHHFGDGQLAQHTMEVAKLCAANIATLLDINPEYNDLDPQDAFFAALFHDVGKTWDYSTDVEGKWISLDHKKKVRHIARSAIIWNEAATKFGYPAENREEVLHAILAHHQLREWGSPVTPHTRLAWLLHLSDNMSAKMHDVYSRLEYY